MSKFDYKRCGPLRIGSEIAILPDGDPGCDMVKIEVIKK
jgi:hypothetical protein